MLSAVRTTAYSVIAVGGRRSGASRCAATPRPRPLLEHFSLNQLCQLDATAYEPIHPALATARIVLAWRMSISSQAGAAVSRNVALGASSPIRHVVSHRLQSAETSRSPVMGRTSQTV